jgi:hypothetical protein
MAVQSIPVLTKGDLPINATELSGAEPTYIDFVDSIPTDQDAHRTFCGDGEVLGPAPPGVEGCECRWKLNTNWRHGLICCAPQGEWAASDVARCQMLDVGCWILFPTSTHLTSKSEQGTLGQRGMKAKDKCVKNYL